jgi:hypothetical protein
MSNSKNVEAFNGLIGICTGYGGTYSPGSPNLRVESLSELLNQARSALRQVSISKTGYESATNAREVKFTEIRKLASRILAELKSSGVLPQTVADAAAMVRKIKGRVKAERPEATSKGDTSLPVVYRPKVNGSDFASVVYHLEKLIATLEAEPKYAPGISTLKVESLQQKLAELRAANQAVVEAVNALHVARSERDALLYTNPESIHKTALAVKQQLKAIFGPNSDAMEAANRIVVNKRLS